MPPDTVKENLIMETKIHIPLYLAISILLSACHRETKSNIDIVHEVEVGVVVRDTIPTRYSSIGYVDAVRHISIAPRTSGYLLSINYAAGQPVEKGELLFTIDSRLATTALAAAEASLASANAKLIQARNNYERALPLAAIEAISQSQMDSYLADYRAAEAEVASSRQQIEKSRIEVGFASILSPATGIISRSNAEIGDYVGEGTSLNQLATIAITDTMSVTVNIPTKLYLQHAGTRHTSFDNSDLLSDITLYLSNGNRYDYAGSYSYTKQDIAPQSSSLEIVVNFPNPDNELKVGEFARVEFSIGTPKPSLLLPIDAIMQLQDLNFVWVVGSNNTVEQRRIELGDVVGTNRIVNNGVTEGDRVVLGGGARLRNGQQVSVK